jgi:hypothetical protein
VTTEVLLVARSIGRRTRAEPLSAEGHAGLVIQLDQPWIVQAGPDAGLLQGTLVPCGGRSWRDAFAEAPGAVWDSGATETLAVALLRQLTAPAADPGALTTIVAELNARRLAYRYDPGPNSNTFVRWVLAALGTALPAAPEGPLELRGWSWDVPSV